MEKPQCESCRHRFEPNPSKQAVQRFCSKRRCQRERHRLACHAYRRKNPDDDKSRRPKIRAWAAETGYWPQWRRDHPDYRQRDNARRRAAYRRSRSSAKRDARKRLSLEKLRSIQELSMDLSANRDVRDRRVDELLNYLVWKETPQTETHAGEAVIPTQ